MRSRQEHFYEFLQLHNNISICSTHEKIVTAPTLQFPLHELLWYGRGFGAFIGGEGSAQTTSIKHTKTPKSNAQKVQASKRHMGVGFRV